MARRKQQNVVTALESAEALARAIAESEKYLTVVDVHAAWTGPCTVIEPVFRKMFVDLDKPEERLKIYTVRAGGRAGGMMRHVVTSLGAQVNADLLSDDQRKHLPLHGCKPLFVVYKQKVIIAKIAGVNAPELEAAIVDNVPAVETED